MESARENLVPQDMGIEKKHMVMTGVMRRMRLKQQNERFSLYENDTLCEND